MLISGAASGDKDKISRELHSFKHISPPSMSLLIIARHFLFICRLMQNVAFSLLFCHCLFHENYLTLTMMIIKYVLGGSKKHC